MELKSSFFFHQLRIEICSYVSAQELNLFYFFSHFLYLITTLRCPTLIHNITFCQYNSTCTIALDPAFGFESEQRKNYPPSTPSWLVSLVGRALHRYRRGHGFKSRTGLNLFQALFSLLLKQSLLYSQS